MRDDRIAVEGAWGTRRVVRAFGVYTPWVHARVAAGGRRSACAAAGGQASKSVIILLAKGAGWSMMVAIQEV